MTRATLIAGGLVLATAIAGPAQAACIDPPRPGVNWQRCIHDRATYREVDLEGARLGDATFQRATLDGSRFVRIDGTRSRFVSASLKGAVFDFAKLGRADFTRADLTGAQFREADLRRARLFRANLKGANLTGARLDGADLLNADLSGATWVDGTTVCAEGSIGTCR